ncbi:MAG: glycosyl transferase [Coxiella sp. RIFCSPHIGHO2_12_FULL_42_15]|nr:MAG: glycosyl transferase [Coxiella sp. RIFCSPHIGHO2_12_FULL_42_15]
MNSPPRIAVLLPCYNEAAAIGQVVKAFYAALPESQVYVYDNRSTDNTVEMALAAGAIVRREPRKGKGNVVRRMFADIDADIYVLADGDCTYDASAAPQLIHTLLQEKLDMVVGTRVDSELGQALYRKGHRLGNALFTKIVGSLFGNHFTDILSGYRAFSRRFVKSFPALSRGFDIEAELTIHSLELRIPVGEVATPYFSRPEGSQSKLNKYRDGIVILFRIISMLKETRPFFFFTFIALVFAMLSVFLAIPLFYSYFTIGLVPRIPTAILTTGVMILACISFMCGIMLDSVCRGRRERKYLHYLSLPWLLVTDDE